MPAQRQSGASGSPNLMRRGAIHLRAWLRRVSTRVLLVPRGNRLTLVGANPARFGIVAHLGVAFIAVAALALDANLIVERGGLVVRTIRIQAPPRTVLIPVVDSARLPADPPHIISAEPLLAAIERFDRAVVNRAAAEGSESARQLRGATAELTREGHAYVTAAGGVSDADRLHAITEQLNGQRDLAAALVRAADSRRNWMQVCWMRFEALDSRTKASLDAGWKIFGRIFARQTLLDLSRQLDGMRRDLSHFEAREAVSDADRQAMAADESAFASTLERISASLSRFQGQAWLTAMRADLAALSSERAALLRSEEQQRQSNVDYAAGSAALRALLRTASVAGLATTSGGNGDSADAAGLEPTAAALAAPHGPATVESAEPITTTSTQRTQPVQQVSIAWVSGAVLLLLGVICIGTTLRIVAPVRRMMRATRMLAQGALQTRVRRGGIRELDALATSFNVMAQQLAVAQEISRDHQHELETRIVQRTRELQHLAEHDALTELPNRLQLFAQLQAALDHAGAKACLVGVFILDLDNFKNLNDSIGHAYGDSVLQSVAQRLEQTVSSFGFSARLGGDEFTVVFERASDVQQIHAAGARLMQAFQEPLLVDGRELLLSISVGASFYPDHAQNAEALLRAADAALFQAKQLGRNQLRVYSPGLLEAAKSRFSTEQGLRHAIERGEFELAFQPEVHVGTFDVRMVETLLRWRQQHGMHPSTTEFLAVAEESGLILEISDWVLHSAIQTAASWYHGKWPAVRMAINVSARQLLDRQFVDRIQGLLRTHRLPSHCIEIELTENVVQTGASTLEALHSLRDCGIGVALDDFGAGYSSIASLEQLPLTRVKLDRSLIAGIDSSARSLTITEAIIKLATGLGLEITAEGIERPQQLALLLKHDSLFLQGYLLSRAVPAQELPALLRTMSDRMQLLLLSIDASAGRSGAPAVEPRSDAARSTG